MLLLIGLTLFPARLFYLYFIYTLFPVQIKELHKYYANTPGVCDLVHQCLQVSDTHIIKAIAT